MEKISKSQLIILGISLIIIPIYYYYVIYGHGIHNQYLAKNGIKDTCEVTALSLKNVTIHYKIGEEYGYYKASKPYNYIQVGERFLFAYELKNTSRVKILFDRPVLPKNIAITHTLEARDVWEDNSLAFFSYVVEGKKYKRLQRKPDGVKIDKNKKYIVKYDISNPSIGYIILK